MPTVNEPMTTSKRFRAAEIAAAKAAAAIEPAAKSRNVDWAEGVVTPGGGAAATVSALRRTHRQNKRSVKAILDASLGANDA